MVYVGTLMSGGPRTVVGFSVGSFPRSAGSVLGLELDYVRTTGDRVPGRSYISIFGGSLLVQSNVIARRLQIYGAGGGGLYGEAYIDGPGSGEVGCLNIGGGVKITAAGPLKIRVDYRLFFLGDSPDSSLEHIHRHPQRVVAGVGLAF